MISKTIQVRIPELIADIQLIKDMGCNFVRGSHYPQDQRFLDLCDEMGLLVFEESMGWGQSAAHFTNKNLLKHNYSRQKR